MLNRYDPWGHHRGHDSFDLAPHWGMTPFIGRGLLDTFFNDEDFTPRIRDHAGQLQIKDNGDFEYRVDVGGFRPEEVGFGRVKDKSFKDGYIYEQG